MLRYGNAVNLVGYQANGESTDWMFGEMGIISFSPELGSDDKTASDKFYPEKKEILPILEFFFENF